MCGRYYVDDDTTEEIEKLVCRVDEKMKRTGAAGIRLQAKDIHPSDTAPVLTVDDMGLCCKWQRWGFPGFNGKGSRYCIWLGSMTGIRMKSVL